MLVKIDSCACLYLHEKAHPPTISPLTRFFRILFLFCFYAAANYPCNFRISRYGQNFPCYSVLLRYCRGAEYGDKKGNSRLQVCRATENMTFLIPGEEFQRCFHVLQFSSSVKKQNYKEDSWLQTMFSVVMYVFCTLIPMENEKLKQWKMNN